MLSSWRPKVGGCSPWIMGLSPGPATTLKGQWLMSSCTSREGWERRVGGRGGWRGPRG